MKVKMMKKKKIKIMKIVRKAYPKKKKVIMRKMKEIKSGKKLNH